VEWLVTLLRAQREDILSNWLAAVRREPFHRNRPERAVSDDIPRLYDALVGLVEHDDGGRLDDDVPFDDPGILSAAQAHARARAEQGLQPAEVVVEFRLLRRAVRHALRTHLPEALPISSAAGSELILVDALDGAIAVGLTAFTEHAETVREEFLATTVHEVRHPVTAILGNAQFIQRLLGRATPDLQRVATAAVAIREETEQMSALLNVLSDATQAALGHLTPQVAPVDLVALVGETLAALDPQIAARVRLDVAPDLDGEGSWDAGQLRQVLVNLLSNAAKYAPSDTPITVQIAAEPGAAHLSVHDDGIGIAREDLSRLFQRYVRTRAAQEAGIAGLGLGLYLCRAIVEGHGGRIWAESPGVGQGTTLHVWLPRHGPPDAPAGTPAPNGGA